MRLEDAVELAAVEPAEPDPAELEQILAAAGYPPELAADVRQRAAARADEIVAELGAAARHDDNEARLRTLFGPTR